MAEPYRHEIADCASCPFATRTEFPREPACGAGDFLGPDRYGRPVPFDERKQFADGWHDVYPSPPPDWCPLRARPTLLVVR